ncbi:MAG: hypothetical protein Q9209_000550 [Squamulea sp. 1 TL-2023]
MYAVAVFREAVADMAREKGADQKCGKPSLRAMARGIVVTILDPLLAQKSLREIHDALDILLVCCYQNKVHAELRGTLFDIEEKKRFASVVIAEAIIPPANEESAES